MAEVYLDMFRIALKNWKSAAIITVMSSVLCFDRPRKMVSLPERAMALKLCADGAARERTLAAESAPSMRYNGRTVRRDCPLPFAHEPMEASKCVMAEPRQPPVASPEPTMRSFFSPRCTLGSSASK